MRKMLMIAAVLPFVAVAQAQQPAQQQQPVTVKSLLAQDFVVVGASTSMAGGGSLYLQKKEKLYYCYITETPDSATVATRYCKPVE